MKQLKAPVTSAIEVADGIYLLQVEAPEIAAEAKPGQFVMVPCDKDMILPRPFSIHTAGEGKISILFAVVGKGTEWLSHKKKGDRLDIFGPLGNGFTVNEKSRNLLLVAGGMGIAPMRFLAEKALEAKKLVTILNGARTVSCLIAVTTPQNLFEKGIHPASLHCVNTTEDGTEGFKGLATQLIPHYLKNADQVFACGPEGMYKTMAQMRVLQNIPVQISMEIMMGCGTGVCYGCTIKTQKGLKQVCKDGPVFEMADIIF